jgi:hypothetical protein
MTTEYKAYEPTNTDVSEDELRRRAVKRLQAKAGFWTHLAVYLAVNAFLVMIWFFTGTGFFWPIFPIAGWGIGVAASAWDAFGREPITESESNARWTTCVGNTPASVTGESVTRHGHMARGGAANDRPAVVCPCWTGTLS